MLRIGVDTGGTFTDLVGLEEGRRWTHKVPSTPDDPSRAVLSGLAGLLAARPGGEGAGGPPPPGTAVVHGSTVATNALLEGKGEAVALLATAGFEDLLELGRQARPDLYDASVAPPDPLVPALLRFGIGGRLGPRGEEITPLAGAQVRAAVERARKAGVTRFAICFLHSYARPHHEEEAGRLVEAAGGEATLSCRVLPEYREFERTSTTVINASLAPVMSRYLHRLERALPGCRLSVFRSNGGILSAAAAGREAVQTLLSGPAAGVLGAWEWGRRLGLERLITFDMGGTSTDIALVDGGPSLTTETEIAGHPVRLPLIDIHTVGAGGGSLARRDEGGALLVGPASAGADPGPACYGRGRQPTVTDAQLLLGRLPPGRFLGGRMRLHPERATEALARLAADLGLDLEAAAAGVVQVANAGMERALRVVSVARGHDPRQYALFCYGGAGGLHAADLAAALGMPEVIVPPDAGVFSALGMLAADVVRDASCSVLAPLAGTGRARRDALAAPLEARLLEEMEGEGFTAGGVALERTLDLRYAGQSFELSVPEGEDPEEAFQELHQARYDHHRRGTPVELVALRVRARGRLESPWGGEGPPGPEAAAAIPAPPPADRIGAWFGGGRRETGVWLREDLAPGHELTGPGVVAEAGSTTVVPPGWRLVVDGLRNLRLRPEGGQGGAGGGAP